MKKLVALIMVIIMSFCYATAEDTTVNVSARNNKLAEIIVTEDGSPRSTERGRILKDGDNSMYIITTERLYKKPTLIRLRTLSRINAGIQVISGLEDQAFGDDLTLYLQACLRFFDKAGHYLRELDGVSPEEAVAAGAVYASMAKFHSSIYPTEVARVAFNGGATVLIGYTTTKITVETLDGTKVLMDQRHYAIMGVKTSNDNSGPSSKPTPTPAGSTATPTLRPTEDTDWTIGSPTPTPTASPTPAPTEGTDWTIGKPTPTPSPKPTESTDWTIGSGSSGGDSVGTNWTIGGGSSSGGSDTTFTIGGSDSSSGSNVDSTGDGFTIGGGSGSSDSGSSSGSSGSSSDTDFSIGGGNKSTTTDSTNFSIGGSSSKKEQSSSPAPTAGEDTGFSIGK